MVEFHSHTNSQYGNARLGALLKASLDSARHTVEVGMWIQIHISLVYGNEQALSDSTTEVFESKHRG